VIRDKPRRRKSEVYRNEEWVACGVPPAQVDEIAREHTRGKYAVCAMLPQSESDTELRAGYKVLGYRLGRTESVFVHRLRRVPRAPQPAGVTVRPARTAADGARLAKEKKWESMPAEHLAANGPMRHYLAELDGVLAGSCTSVVAGTGWWCSGMHVKPAYRRRGIGRALACAMLRDDRSCGAALASLLASHTGAKLYPTVGYEQVGMLDLYTPPRGKATDRKG
jgi:GNAT superfamily N-acetyltransferase